VGEGVSLDGGMGLLIGIALGCLIISTFTLLVIAERLKK
jgi:hypothetical protein